MMDLAQKLIQNQQLFFNIGHILNIDIKTINIEYKANQITTDITLNYFQNVCMIIYCWQLNILYTFAVIFN